MGLNYYGRRAIYTDAPKVTPENIISVLTDAMSVHNQNRQDVFYLENYERGDQPILYREKAVRSDVNNKVVENHASSIVDFKAGYIFGSPVAYVQRADIDSDGENDDSRVSLLVEMMVEQAKQALDQELAHETFTAGVAYRMVMPRKTDAFTTSPFQIINLDPKTTFLVRANDIYRTPLLGVTYSEYIQPQTGTTEHGIIRQYSCYTPDAIYEVKGDAIVKQSSNPLGCIPIVEYIAGVDRMGVFEKVIPLLNAINMSASDRQNAIQQTIEAILVLLNTDAEQKDIDSAAKMLVLCLNSPDGQQRADAKMLDTKLDQSAVQQLVDHQIAQMLDIAGVPGRQADANNTTGEAVMLSSGWQLAETSAKSFEPLWKRAEMEMLSIILRIFRKDNTVDAKLKTLKLSDIDIKFSRNRVDGLLTKVQAMCQLIETGFANKHALEASGLWSDVQTVWDDSKDVILKKYGGGADDQSVDRLGKEPTAADKGAIPEGIHSNEKAAK